MRKPSITYRFFCTLTALVVFLGTGIPAVAHSGMLAEFCDLEMPEHHSSHMAKGEHCDLPTHHNEAGHDGHTSTKTDKGNDDCPLEITCSCSIDEAATRTSAIPSLSKTFAGYVPVVIDILDNKLYREHQQPSEQVFASLYSPPLFLKNSSFLN